MAVLVPNLNPPVFSKLGIKSTGLPRPLHGQRWYVALTKSRREKKLGHWLHEHAVSYFLPMQAKKTSTNGIVHELIYPGFLFFLGYPTDQYTAWESRHLRGLLKTDDQFLLRHDLRQVARIIRDQRKLVAQDLVKVGCRVRIVKGHVLEGIEARVDLRRKNHVVLDIHMVGSRSFEIDAKFLEVIPCR